MTPGPAGRRFVQANGRPLLAAAAVLAVGLFGAVMIASWRQSPDLAGLLSGFFSGLFVALLALLGAVCAMVWLGRERSAPPPVDAALLGAVNAQLAPTIRDLEAIRAEVRAQVRRRASTRVPLGVAGAVLAWIALQLGEDPPGLFDLLTWLAVGGLAGQAWAAEKLARSYGSLYQQRVLPQLAARHGDLAFRAAGTAGVTVLARHRIFRAFDTVDPGGEIAGTHRGLPICIAELALTHGSGEDRRSVFEGLLVEIGLPRSLSGTTAVMADEGTFDNLREGLRQGAMARVRLEDPGFERRFQAYATDQVQARALLMPAFMQRLIALETTSRFRVSGVLAEGNRLLVALAMPGARRLFRPPSYWQPAGGAVLVELTRDIEAVLNAADAVIALDYFAQATAAP